MLSTSPVLDTLMLLSTIAVTGPEHHRIIARRKELPEQVKRALRLTGDRDVVSVIDGATDPGCAGGRTDPPGRCRQQPTRPAAA